jgi:hypothetical protein
LNEEKTMSTEKSLIDAALRGWKSNVESTDKLFGALSQEQLEQQVAPGRNRLIYLWGHLAAVNDGLLPLLGIGERLHPELDAMFIAKPDKSVELTVTGKSLKAAWDEINQKLWEGYSEFSAADWAGRHTAVSEEDFEREPHRNRFTNGAPCLSRGSGDLGAAKGIISRLKDRGGLRQSQPNPSTLQCSVCSPGDTQ